MTVMIPAAILIAGKEHVITSASYQPLVYPIKNPKNVILNVIMKVGTFSPIAPWTEKVSFATLLERVLGLMVSNQPTS